MFGLSIVEPSYAGITTMIKVGLSLVVGFAFMGGTFLSWGLLRRRFNLRRYRRRS